MDQKYDYIIVGKGIVGTILSFKLIQLGKKVLVIDNNDRQSSSHVAAGIINPITGRNYVKSWLTDILKNEYIKTYKEIELFLGNTYLIDRVVHRVLHTVKEENSWMLRSGDEAYYDYISIELYKEENPFLKTEGIIGKIHNAGQLRISALVDDFGEYLIKNERFLGESFDYKKMVIQKDKILYGNFESKNIIFCEGYQVTNNPYFNYLPFDPVKGEALIIHCADLKIDYHHRDQIFISPLGNDTYWVGAGYNKNYSDNLPSLEEKKRLSKILNNILKTNYQIIDHKAGIRPAVRTRKPLLGVHPQYNNLFICNGMGAKGSSLSPYFTGMLINFIENGQALDKEVDITKYITN